MLAGRYELAQLLGTGGMAEVYAAVDRRLGRTVAVKVLRSELAHDESVRSRFRREAQSAASLNHPTVVAVHDTGDLGDDVGEPFIVMEYVPGHTLRDVMHRGQPMPVDYALEITAGVLTALEFAHRAGIVHRDIKPGNIMLTPDGVVKVMDFGIARALNDDLTITQTVVGTPAYLSPEHAEGQPVDERSDLYSTGCVLFELLTGRPPFDAESAYVVAVQHIQEAPPVPSTLNPALPPVLDQIVARALAKDRQARYQTAAQFRADLEAVRAGKMGGALPRSGAQDDPTDPIVLDTTARMPSSAAVPLAGGGLAPAVAAVAGLPAPPGPSTPVQPSSPAPVALSESAAASDGVMPPVTPGAVPPAAVVPAMSAVHPGGQGPGVPVSGPVKRRWPWLVGAAAGAVIVVAVVVAVVMNSGGGPGFTSSTDTPKPGRVGAFDLATVHPRPDTRESVVTLSTDGLIWKIGQGTVWPLMEQDKKNGVTTVTISADILFEFGKADLNDDGKTTIIAAVKDAPNGASIDVTGYTDTKGTDTDNAALSQARAEAVAVIITDARRDLTVNPVGKGSADPVASNTNDDGSDSPEGRAKNRRVEIRFSG